VIDRRGFLLQAAALPFLDALQDTVDAALARARETGRWVVVLVAPADRLGRRRFGEQLWGLTRVEREIDLLSQAVFAVVKHGRYLDVDRVLLHPDGRRLAADQVKPEVYASAKAFIASFTPFIHGGKGERLEERGRATEAAQGTPWLAWRAGLGEVDARRRLREHTQALPDGSPGARLPYGCAEAAEWIDPCETCGMAEVDEVARRFLRILEH
jgi:hypothetical protein